MSATTTPDGTILVQLSDLHIGPPGVRPYGTDTAGNLRTVAATVREMALEPAAILLTGDLTDAGDAASYEHLRELVAEELEPIGCPVLPVVGNHDHRGSFHAAYLGSGLTDDDPYHYTCDVGTTRIMMLDSYHAGHITGLLGDEQLAWLDAELAVAGGRTCVLALHHPSVPRGVPRADDYLLADRDEFAAVVARHDVAVILCGHSHVSTVAAFAGTVHAAAPATAYLLDPSRRRGNRAFAVCGFAICTIREGRAVVNPFIVPVGAAELYQH
jgi:3',5'-cyclic AMP phosphodiesterase CpdA